MYKKICAFLLVVGLLLGVTACSGSPASDTPEDDRIVLKMASWMDESSLNQILIRYNDSQDKYRIVTESIYDETLGFDGSQAAASVTVMTDRSFDLYYLAGLDVAAMKQAGLLRDLYPMMEQDDRFHREDYYMHLWDLYAMDGHLYEFVPAFTFSGLLGARRWIGDRSGWTFNEFYAAQDAWSGAAPYCGLKQDTFLTFMIQYGMSDYVDLATGACDFENQSFYDWMDFIRSYPDRERTPTCAVSAGWVFGLADYYQLCLDVNDTYQIVGMPGDSAPGPCLWSIDTFGIAANSPNAEACWDFLMFLLEPELLEEQFFMGFSMQRSVNEAWLDACLLPNDDPNAFFYGWELDGKPYPSLTQENVDYLRHLLESVDLLWLRSNDVLTIVEEEMQVYLHEDDFTAQEIAARIQQRVSVCLSERIARKD